NSGRTKTILGSDPVGATNKPATFDLSRFAQVYVPITLDKSVVGLIEAGCQLQHADRVLTPANITTIETLASTHSEMVAQARPYVLLKLIAEHAMSVIGAAAASLHVYHGHRPFLLAGAGKATPPFLARFAPRPEGIGWRAMTSGDVQTQKSDELL